MIGVGGTVLAAFGGLLETVGEFPLFWKVSFWTFGCLTVVAVLAHGLKAFRDWRARRAETDAMAQDTGVPEIRQTFVHAEAGSSGSIVGVGNIMLAGTAKSAPVPRRPLDESPEALSRLADALAGLYDEMCTALQQLHEIHAAEDYMTARTQEDHMKRIAATQSKEREWADHFRRTTAPRLTYLRQQSYLRGFGPDPSLADDYWHHPLMFGELVSTIGAISAEVRDASDAASG